MGYVIVIEPEGGIGFNGMKPIVTRTHIFPALRSKVDIANDGFMSCTKIDPDSTGNCSSSKGVFNDMRPPAATCPMEKPVMVTKNTDAEIAAPAVVITTEVFVVALHVAVSPGTLLLPAATVGVTFGAKKPEGYVSVMVPPAGIKCA